MPYRNISAPPSPSAPMISGYRLVLPFSGFALGLPAGVLAPDCPWAIRGCEARAFGSHAIRTTSPLTSSKS